MVSSVSWVCQACSLPGTSRWISTHPWSGSAEDEVRDARRLELLAIYRGHAAFSFCERLREWNGHLAGISVSLRKYCWNSRVTGSP